MAGPENYALSKLGDGFAPPAAGKRSSTPQPQHTWSKQRGNDAIERQPRSKSRDGRGPLRMAAQHAADLKVPVKNTLLNGPKPLGTQAVQQNHPAIARVAQYSKSHGHNARPHREPAVSAFDDTQSIHFDDSTSIAEEQDSRPDLRLTSHTRNERFNNQPQYLLNKSLGHMLPGWKAEADQERERHGEHPKYRKSLQHNTAESIYNNEQSDDGYEPDGEYYPEEEGPEANDTPSRPRLVVDGHPEVAAPIQFVKQEAHHAVPEQPADLPSPPPQHRNPFGDVQHGAHVGPFPEQSKNRFQIGKQVKDNGPERPVDTVQRPASVPAPQPRLQTTQPPPFSSKVSSYHESSSDGEQASKADPAAHASPTRPSKRQREDQDLDFDMDTLTKKSIADLDTIPFTVDPRLPVAEPAVDATGTPMTLAAKLTNLTKMRPDDQRQLFRSLTDAEREETAAWFLDKFHADVQRLMDVRLERRKVALRYELEVKKREKSVQTKMIDVEDELAGLRKGGGELISGKVPGKRTED